MLKHTFYHTNNNVTCFQDLPADQHGLHLHVRGRQGHGRRHPQGPHGRTCQSDGTFFVTELRITLLNVFFIYLADPAITGLLPFDFLPWHENSVFFQELQELHRGCWQCLDVQGGTLCEGQSE